jgi:hypothetical protein
MCVETPAGHKWFTEYQKIYSAHEAVITFLFDMKFEDTKGY